MNKREARKLANIRRGHKHSPPVRKLEIVQANMRVSLDNVHQSSGSLQGTIHRAKALSPTKGAYAPIFGQGQAKPIERVTPADRKKFAGEKEKYHTVEIITDAKRLKTKAITKHKQMPATLNLRGPALNVKRPAPSAELPTAEYNRIRDTLGLRR